MLLFIFKLYAFEKDITIQINSKIAIIKPLITLVQKNYCDLQQYFVV